MGTIIPRNELKAHRKVKTIGNYVWFILFNMVGRKFHSGKKEGLPSSYSSRNAKLHAATKNILCEINPQADACFQNNPDQLSLLVDLILNGNIIKLLEHLQNVASQFVNADKLNTMQDCFNNFINNFITNSIPPERLTRLQNFIQQQLNNLHNYIFLGNSAICIRKIKIIIQKYFNKKIVYLFNVNKNTATVLFLSENSQPEYFRR